MIKSSFTRLCSNLESLLFVIFLCLMSLNHAQAEETEVFKPSPTLDAIKKRGEIVVGVKTDFPPFGMLNAEGKPIGIEIDLAQHLADTIGVRLVTRGVTAENRFQRLEQGNIDLILATTGDTKERRQLATVIEPDYFSAGPSVLLRPEINANDWADLRGKTLCALQGAYFNKPIRQRFLVELSLYKTVRDAELAMRDKHCVGFLYDQITLKYLLTQPEWANYTLSLPTVLEVPWAIFIARSEKNTVLEEILGNTVASWHKDGTLIDTMKAWDLKPNRFLLESHALWTEKNERGNPVCQRNAAGQWPFECRNPAFVRSDEVDGIKGIGLWLKELGIPLSIIYDADDAKRYLEGILWTIALSVGAVLGALVLGYWGAKIILSGSGILAKSFTLLANFARMTPPILQMYLVFFGLGGLLFQYYELQLSPFLVALWSLSFYHAGIIVFTLIESATLQKSKEASFNLSLRTLPKLIEHSAVGIRTSLNNLVKATTIASAIAVPELLSATIAIIGDQGNIDLMMNLLLIVFYLISTLWLFVIIKVERKLIQKFAQPA